MRRRLPFLLAWGLGLIVLLWGMVSLQRIFISERNDARSAITSRRDALREYGRQSLEQRLTHSLKEARPRIATAVADPLADATGLLLVDDRGQQLPRVVLFRSGDTMKAVALADDLKAGKLDMSDLDADDPWRDRLVLFERFRRALASRDEAAIASTFRGILTHRARFVISARKDVPYQLVLYEMFVAQSQPHHELLEDLIRDGLDDSKGQRLPGLQRLFLAKRRRFTQLEFEALAKRIAALSEAARIRHDDFSERVAETQADEIEVPESLLGPMLINGGSWYLEAGGAGIAIDFNQRLETVTSEMRDRDLIGPEDELVVHELPRDVALYEVPVHVHSTVWDGAERSIQQRFLLKTGLGVTLGAFALAIVLLGAGFQRRQQQFLALKSDFVATVSHELRTPLASVRLLAETLERRLTGEEKARDYPGRIIKEVDNLTFLVENILSFNRLDKGRWEPQLDELRLGELVELLREELPAHTQAQVQVSCDDDLVLHVDRDLMKLLFLNLGSNACKYNETDPVKIEIEASTDPLVIRVSDNGVGIPEEARDQIFTEFYRAAGMNGSRGFGLGLAICKRIMNIHEGDIRVADTGSAGTVFELSFK